MRVLLEPAEVPLPERFETLELQRLVIHGIGHSIGKPLRSSDGIHLTLGVPVGLQQAPKSIQIVER